MSIFSIFKKHIKKDIALQCVEYYEDNDIFLKTDNNYSFLKEKLITKNKISYQDMQNFFGETRGSNFSFFKKYNPILYKAFHNKKSLNEMEHSFPFEKTICIRPNLQDSSHSKKLSNLLSQNMDKKYLIIDLKNSPGGGTKTCASLCDILLPKCEIFIQKFKNKVVTYTSDENYYKFEKIFIFIDKNTASSSEILAYSLYTNLKNVVLIGSETRGKTCGQDIITNKKYGFIFSVTSFLWQIKNFSYENIEMLKPNSDNYMNEVQRQIS